LTDLTGLAAIARNNKATLDRRAAVRRLIDEALLTEIARTDDDPDVRREAVRRLTRQTTLAEIAGPTRIPVCGVPQSGA